MVCSEWDINQHLPNLHRKQDIVTMVTLFTKPGCVQCTMTAKVLTQNKIDYQSVDVTQNQDAFNKVVDMGYRQMPVVVAGEEHWTGFRPDKLNNLVA